MSVLSTDHLRKILLRAGLAPLITFLLSFALLFWFFLSTTNTWSEPLIASLVFATGLGFFAFIVALAPRYALVGFFGALFVLFLISSLFVPSSNLYGDCPISTYCFNAEELGRIPYLLITLSYKVILLMDVVVFSVLGFRVGLTLLRLYPQARYYLGSGIFFFFVALMSIVYYVLKTPVQIFQMGLMAVYILLGAISLVLGLRYKKHSDVNRLQHVFVAGLVSSLFLLPLLVPWDESTAPQEVLWGYGFFIGFAVLAFFGLLFLKKKN